MTTFAERLDMELCEPCPAGCGQSSYFCCCDLPSDVQSPMSRARALRAESVPRTPYRHEDTNERSDQ